MFEEIRDKENEKVKKRVEVETKNVTLLKNAIKGILALGYDVTKAASFKFLQDEKSEIDKMIKNNSIFDAYISGIMLSLLTKKLQLKKQQLKIKCKEINTKIERKIAELSIGVTGKKRKVV